MIIDDTTRYWLPIRFRISRSAVAVNWMDFSGKSFSEPFFHQTLRKLRTKSPPAQERTTGIAALMDMVRELPSRRPEGIIFHISRCGSTLLANALRTGTSVVVLSEAAPLGLFFRPNALRDSPFPEEGRCEAIRMLMESVIGLYSRDETGRDVKVLIKCHTVSILEIARIRSIWPDVPFLVVIRDPADVIVSNALKPAGWVRGRRNPRYTMESFGLDGSAVREMSLEEYCARGIGRFCEAAQPFPGTACKVIDYDDIGPHQIRRVAEFFGVCLPDRGSDQLVRVLGTYSKDPAREKTFERDRQWKSDSTTTEVREMARRWAWNDYSKLRALSRW